MDPITLISGISAASKIIAELSGKPDLSVEESTQLSEALKEVRLKTLELQTKAIEMQAEIIKSDNQSDSWLAKNWRPITILTMLLLLVIITVCRLFSISTGNLSPAFETNLFEMISYSILGYGSLRTLEKGVNPIRDAAQGVSTILDKTATIFRKIK